MCFIALMVWLLTCANEFRTIWSLVRALVVIPRGDKTTINVDANGGVSIAAISRVRLGAIMGLQCTRCVVAVFLCYYGCLFLGAATVGVGDLLLNAVALEFVITLDELIFASLAPASTQSFIGNVQGLRIPPPRKWRGLDGHTTALFVGVLGVLGCVYRLVVIPQVRACVCANTSQTNTGRESLAIEVL